MDTQAPAPTRPIAERLKNMLALASVPVFAAALASVLPTGLWFIELTSSFRPQLVILLVLVGLALWRRPRWRYAALGATLALLISMLPATLGAPRTAPDGSEFRVVVANVYSDNPTPEALVDLVREEAPDVLVLMEVTPAWSGVLAELEADYPHRLTEPRSDNFGISVWSRTPMVASVVELGHAGVPSIVADVSFDSPVRIIATHPLPPISAEYARLRDEQLAEVAAHAAASDTPTLVVGDLNAAGWSSAVRRLRRDGDLRLAARGWAPTWPVGMPLLAVPLDHALVSDGLQPTAFRRLAAIGSDHRPIRVDLRRVVR